VIDEPGIGGDFVAAHGHQGHGFGATGYDDFGGAAADCVRRLARWLAGRRSRSGDGHGGGLDGQTGAESGDAGDVHALLAFGHGTAEDYVIDLLGVDGGGTRARASLMAKAARSSGRVARSEPL